MVRFEEPIITSLLDKDLYDFTMGQAMRNRYPNVIASFDFINRGKTPFPKGFAEELRYQIDLMGNLRVLSGEAAFLRERCGHYIDRRYIDWLEYGYRPDPSQVEVSQTGSEVKVSATGPVDEVQQWEKPILATIQELVNKFEGNTPADDFLKRAERVAKRLHKAGVPYSEFGARRRFNYAVQEAIIPVHIDHGKTSFRGTSNVHFARKYNLTPIGTHAHAWFMLHAGLFGYRYATREALRVWAEEFKGYLGFALTDTFTTDVFLRDFNAYYAKLFDGVRHDSGDPYVFTDKMVAHYGSLRIDPRTRQIVFADALDDDKAIAIHEYCKGKIFQDSYGIGTFLTNNAGAPRLNIVYKMNKIIRPEEPDRWIYVVKFSDDPGKTSGNQEAIEHGRYDLHI
jgi:nicotinate phosphoribosyltransferase